MKSCFCYSEWLHFWQPLVKRKKLTLRTLSKSSQVLLRIILRVAEEGIAMLGDRPTRSDSHRVVDPSRIKVALSSSTRSGESDTLYYVVNFADSTGFALIDADTTSRQPLFAVTEKGNYTPGEVTNTGFDDFVALIESQESQPSTQSEGTIVGVQYRKWITGSEVIVGPLLEVEWGQDAPYSWFCYDEETGLQSRTGCVPTAIAQIMSYHEYPSVLHLTHPYKGDLDSLVLDWGQIKYHEKNGTSIYGCWCANHTHLQHLMREIGERVQTVYIAYIDPDTQTYYTYGNTFGDTIIPGITAFGYNATSFYSYDRSLVVSELNASRPVYCQGLTPGTTSGHAWVIDGYHYQYKVMRIYEEVPGQLVGNLIGEEDHSIDMLHINWGWDGECNGYYQAGVFACTTSQGNYHNYNSNVQILTNFKPAEL